MAPGLAMITVTYGLARFAYGLFLPEMREAFSLSDAALGLIGAGSYVGYCVAIIIALVFTSRAPLDGCRRWRGRGGRHGGRQEWNAHACEAEYALLGVGTLDGDLSAIKPLTLRHEDGVPQT